MTDSRFFPLAAEAMATEIADWIGGQVTSGDGSRTVTGVAPLDLAGPGDLSFLDNPKYRPALAATKAGVCLLAPGSKVAPPEGTTVIEVANPYRGYAAVLQRLYPSAMRNAFYAAPMDKQGNGSPVHPTAALEDGVIVEPGATIGARVEIGRGTLIGAGAAIGAGVRIGRDCAIGANTAIQAAFLGDRVIIHPGVMIGQDGYGFAMGPQGHLKVPQIGRVVIQNDVEIGANCTVDRGANRDTVIGEGTKIDNLCQIAHNVEIGRHCVIVAQTGISGSARIGDFVAIGGQVGVIGHVKIGDGAQIAATSNVKDDVPAGARWGGSPAKPVRQWFREVNALKRLAEGD